MNTIIPIVLFTVLVHMNAQNHSQTQISPEGIAPRQSSYGLIKFEGQPDLATAPQHEKQYGLVAFEGQASQPGRFDNEHHKHSEDYHYGLLHGTHVISQDSNKNQPIAQAYGLVSFQEDNGLDDKPIANQKRRRRRRLRRKPRLQLQANQGFGIQGRGLAGPGQSVSGLGQQAVGINYGYPNGGAAPRPPAAQGALSAVTGALASIARYDDLQCVPRLLCEVAGGRSAPGPGAGVLDDVLNLQPLVTLLAAYNGISASPLFVFGRSVFLGMTSGGNPGICRYAYPQCPTDPDKLVHYLNNHNGGFFRFFNHPQQGLEEQNLQQFYNQLSNIPGSLNQGQQGPLQFGQLSINQQQFAQQYLIGQQPYAQHHYGLLGNRASPNVGVSQSPQSYGFQNQDSLYPNGFEKYGLKYPYGGKLGYQSLFKNKNSDEVTKKIEKRIQNNSGTFENNNFITVGDPVRKWSFPQDIEPINSTETYDYNAISNTRGSRTLIFPEDVTTDSPIESIDNTRKKAKGFHFPETQSNRQYVEYYNYPPYSDRIINHQNYKDVFGLSVNDNVQNIHIDNFGNQKDENLEIVYVLRGNGDPNNPEVIKLKPGQKVS